MSTEKPHELAMGKPKMTHELTRKELEMSFEKPNQMSNNSKLNVSPSKPKGSSRPVDDPTHENKSSPAFPSDPGSIPHEPRSRRLPEWFTPLSEWTEERSAASTRDLAMRLYGTPTMPPSKPEAWINDLPAPDHPDFAEEFAAGWAAH